MKPNVVHSKEYIVSSLDLGRCFTGPDDPALVRGFATYKEAAEFIDSEYWLCQTCCKAVEEGTPVEDTCCHDLGIIWSERRLRRNMNGADGRKWRKQRIRANYSKYKRIRKR